MGLLGWHYLDGLEGVGMSLPILLEYLTDDQKFRVLALDYVTSCGFVPPDDWLRMSEEVHTWLGKGELPEPKNPGDTGISKLENYRK